MLVVVAMAMVLVFNPLQANPTIVLRYGVLIFDIAFVVPVIIAAWCLRGSRPAAPGLSPLYVTAAEACDPSITSLRAIMVMWGINVGLRHAICLVYPAGLIAANSVMAREVTTIVRHWIPAIAGMEHRLAEAGHPALGLSGDQNAAMIWIVSDFSLSVGFCMRWRGLTWERAAWIRASNRATFRSTDLLPKLLDRGIVVLFVWAPPMGAGARGDTNIGPRVERLDMVLAGFRGRRCRF